MTNRQVYRGPALVGNDPAAQDGSVQDVSVWTLGGPPGSFAVLDSDDQLLHRIDNATVAIINGRLTVTGELAFGAGGITVTAADPQVTTAVYHRYSAHVDEAQVFAMGTITVHTYGVTLQANNGQSWDYPGAALHANGTGFVLYPVDYPASPAVHLAKSKGCGCRG